MRSKSKAASSRVKFGGIIANECDLPQADEETKVAAQPIYVVPKGPELWKYPLILGKESLKTFVMRIMKGLRSNLYDHYEVSAIGKEEIRAAELVVKTLQRWIVIIDIEASRTDEGESKVVIKFERVPDFKESFLAKKESIAAKRTERDQKAKEKEAFEFLL